MKKFIKKLSGILALGLLLPGILVSQCTLSNMAVRLRSATSTGSACEVVFDLSWDQVVNSGNKWAYLHFWNAGQYPDLFTNGLAYQNTSDEPTAADLLTSLATIVISGNASATPSINAVYPADNSVLVLNSANTPGLTVEKETVGAIERMTLSNIKLTVPDCNGASIYADNWASQANNGRGVHCINTNYSFVVGNPRISGNILCAVPRNYNITLTNLSPSPVSVTYKMYIDDGDGLYEPVAGHDTLVTPGAVGPFVINAGASYNSGNLDYEPFSSMIPGANKNLWVEVTTAGMPNVTIDLLLNPCIPLAVKLGDFKLTRSGKNIILGWETFMEANNAGFEIQKKTNKGEFEKLDFVYSKASGGNSTSRLVYSYTDINTYNGVCEYRLKMIDINGNVVYSETRAIRTKEDGKIFTVYPNPVDGTTIHIVFADATAKNDVVLYDTRGAVVKKWESLTSGDLNVEKLLPGIYLLKAVNRETGDTYTEKLLFR